MHVVLVMLGGLSLLAIFSLFGWLWGANAAGMTVAAKWFVPVWCVVAGINMWVGVQFAGYTAKEEFPILLLNIAIPVAAAAFAAWRLSHV